MSIAKRAKELGLIHESKLIHKAKHYNTGKIEVIEAIEDWGLGFKEGNVIKYVARAKHKGNELQDLKKAQWYLNRAISQLESNIQQQKGR